MQTMGLKTTVKFELTRKGGRGTVINCRFSKVYFSLVVFIGIGCGIFIEKNCIAIINAYVYHQLNGTLLALEKNGGANNQFTVLL